MNSNPTDASAFGREMWLMLRATFDEASEANGFGNHPEKDQVWAGFMAAANGAMFAQIGPDNAAAINDAIKIAVVDIARSKMQVVRP